MRRGSDTPDQPWPGQPGCETAPVARSTLRCRIQGYRFRAVRANGYNHAMSIAAPRWVGVAGLLGLLAGAIVLMAAPGNPGALRLSGVSLLWWYTAGVAPLGAILLGVRIGCLPAEIADG